LSLRVRKKQDNGENCIMKTSRFLLPAGEGLGDQVKEIRYTGCGQKKNA
jgi:hypothetical protein